MNFCFNQWPERGEVIELWLTKLEGEGTITSASFEFDRKTAEEKGSGYERSSTRNRDGRWPFCARDARRRGWN